MRASPEQLEYVHADDVVVYVTPPVDDFPWMQRGEPAPPGGPALLEASQRIAREHLRWEGDVRDGPYWFSIPYPGQSVRCVIWKQDNDGTCFIGLEFDIRVSFLFGEDSRMADKEGVKEVWSYPCSTRGSDERE